MIQRTLARLLVFLPAVAAAHPGHYHPGEEDEFDALRADWLHLHGPLEIGLAATAAAAAVAFKLSPNRKVKLGAAVAFKLSPNRKVKLGAAVAFGGALASIAAF
ncbi:hypothetical protein [Luteolibacter marinus]|uniref:hypothetical protein n=1 Tax=Luteolibacter marinus TaxID=2776705 RepID=UPI0018675D54|nr:hypothetical protein [Luteolibacter marinus]